MRSGTRPNWVELPDPEFRSRVAALVEGERWVIDGTYAVVRDLVWGRATTIVWLDLPRWQVMLQVIWRSVSRALTGTVLWNGNRERWSMLLTAEHPIRWAWRTYHGRRRHYEAALDARWVRLALARRGAPLARRRGARRSRRRLITGTFTQLSFGRAMPGQKALPIRAQGKGRLAFETLFRAARRMA